MERALREGVTEAERAALEGTVRACREQPGRVPRATCTSLVAQRVAAPVRAVWPIVRSVGSVREVTVVSGLPASAVLISRL